MHHIDHDKMNNDPSNLELVVRKNHLTVGIEPEKEAHYIKLIMDLRKEIEELKDKNNLQIPT